jgi:ubiquinone/menaquinone biosynthesis C-methylase UbiE
MPSTWQGNQLGSLPHSAPPVDTNSVFAEAVPELYDRYLGPALFEPYAADLVRRVVERAGSAVLETACGTGVLTRQLHSQPERKLELTGTDLRLSNPGLKAY